MEPKDSKQPENPMIVHPKNSLFRFPTDATMEQAAERLFALAKAHIPADLDVKDATLEDVSTCNIDAGECELCWLTKQAHASEAFLKFLKKNALGLGPIASLISPLSLWAFAFFFFNLGAMSQKADQADHEVADLEKLFKQ